MTDYINPDISSEQPASYIHGIVDPDQSAGNQVNKSLTRSQADNVPPGLARLYQEQPVPQPQPQPTPAPQPAAPVDLTARHTELLNSALDYASMGWPVIPCHWIWEHAGENRCSCNKPDCDSPGKHPIGKLTPHGLKEATTDPETIRKWWEQYPVANIAVVTGEASGLAVLDLDIKEGKNGQVALEKWCYDNGVTLPETITQQTGSGGFHYLFRYPAGLDIHGATDVLKNDSGIDVRGQNGYIMVEPSCNANGPYSWIADDDPFNGATPADLPPKLLELIGSRKRASAPSGAGVGGGVQWIIPEETVQEVIDALRFIPADLYQRGTDPRTGKEILGWIEIGHALKMMGLGERGFQIWDDWSQKSSKYDPNIMRSKWLSFGPTDITHRSIFKCAQDLGWQNPGAGSSGGAVSFNPETGEINPADLARQYNAVMADAAMAPATVEIDLDRETVQDPAATAMESIGGGIPNELLRFPVPILNEVADWINAHAIDPVPELTVMGALGIASTLTGRIYRSDMGNMTSLFLAGIVDSGIGKNFVKRAVSRFFEQAGIESLLCGSGYTSPGALVSAMREQPTHITIIDEMGNKLKEARKQQNGQLAATYDELKTVFTDVDGSYLPKQYSREGAKKSDRQDPRQKAIKMPAVTVLGLSTPDQFFSEIKYSEVEGGLIGRLLMFIVENREEGDGDGISGKPALPDHVKRWARLVRRLDVERNTGAGVSMSGMDTSYDQEPVTIEVKIDQAARDLYKEFMAFQKSRSAELKAEKLDAIPRRWREISMRIGTLLAACSGASEPRVTYEMADWSIKLIKWCGELTIDNIRRRVSESEHENQQNIFLEAIMRAGRAGVTDRDMNRTKPFRAQKLRDRQEIIATLAAGGLIKKAIIKTAGQPREAWVHFKYAPK